MKVCVVGLGEVGKPVAEYIHCYHETYGFDLRYLKEPFPLPFHVSVYGHFEEIPPCDVYVICVPTDQTNNAVNMISRRIENHALISVESTVSVGWSGNWESLTKHRFDIVHCPHRYWSVDPINHGVRQPRVLGGVTEEALQRAIQFYQSIEIPLYIVRPVEVAELSKIVENAHEYLKIAFAEELAMKCDRLNIPYDQLRQAVNTNTTQDVKLMEARNGIGGKCLPQSADMFNHVGWIAPQILVAAQGVDKVYREEYLKKEGANHET